MEGRRFRGRGIDTNYIGVYYVFPENYMTNYKTNFLTNVIFRVDYPTLLDLSNNNPPAQFQKEIGENYPILDVQNSRMVELRIGSKSETDSPIWRFHNKEKNKVVTVSSDHIALEFFSFNNFTDFSDEVKLIFNRFFSIYTSIKVCKRIGLRFVNQIRMKEGNPLDWNNLIDEDLVFVNRSILEERTPIKKDIHMLELKTDNCDFSFFYGMNNSEYPNPIARREFILDYDAHLVEEADITEIYDKLSVFYGIIKEWFEKSIEDGLRDILRKE